MEIKAISSTVQEGWNDCADRNGGCTHLCLYHPSGRRCACPDIRDPTCSERAVFKTGNRTNTANSKSNYGDFDDPVEDPNEFITVLAVLGVVAALGFLSVFVVIMWWKYKEQSKMAEGPQGGSLTYTNPTYSASNSDVNTDRKSFTWKRLHHETNHHQVRMFDEKGEVAALISEGSSVEHESPPPTPPTRPDTVA
ncbi:hypothetical protein SK128_006313 [Halocaridina rubra]|uniref:Uncharacterized protein n=1 Tax=Halocaridina rubra TaxID=373956 RepID=A0AAN8ZT93_HALRR